MDEGEIRQVPLCSLLPDEIEERLQVSPPFRARQIFKWLARGAADFSQMTDISKGLREELSKRAAIRTAKVARKMADPDGTVKLQLELCDGLAVEAVLLTDSAGRKTACVSCQAGCAMRCAFCMTGTLGLARNLTAGEIVEEFLFLEAEAGSLDNIVFMGMGEPMMNLAAVRKAVEILTHKGGRALSPRRITLSTSGVIAGIYDLADKGPALRLAVSLTTADPALRERLMPVSRTNPLEKLREAIAYYIERTGRRVTLEAALLSGENTGTESARRMIEFARGLDVFINLIPWNPVESLPFKEPSPAECAAFLRTLKGAGLNAELHKARPLCRRSLRPAWTHGNQ